MEARLEYSIHDFSPFGADLYAQLELISKISALELSWKLIESALLVGDSFFISLLGHFYFLPRTQYSTILTCGNARNRLWRR